MPQSGFFMSLDKANAIGSVSLQHSNKQFYCITVISLNNISGVLINQSCHFEPGGWQGSCQRYAGFERESDRQSSAQK